MIIKQASETDIPEIVQVLKASLGEAQLELSEEVWRFKHVNNPFGKSIVLVAIEDESIIGVRALMRWEWKKGNVIFKALRAVDTATHPAHQGKGIFKKLTLAAIEQAKLIKDDFIFNTPNNQSKPGYLKMGWQVVGKIKVGLQPSLAGLSISSPKSPSYTISITFPDAIAVLCDKWNAYYQNENKFFTPKSREFLDWRYENNPLQSYEVIATKYFYLAAYIKKRKSIKELRISECIFDPLKVDKKSLQKIVANLARKFRAPFISFAPVVFPGSLGAVKGQFGPELTLRQLNVSEESYSELIKIENWNHSIGDLELF